MPPPSGSADGKLLDRLADAKERAAIRAEVLKDSPNWENLCNWRLRKEF